MPSRSKLLQALDRHNDHDRRSKRQLREQKQILKRNRVLKRPADLRKSDEECLPLYHVMMDKGRENSSAKEENYEKDATYPSQVQFTQTTEGGPNNFRSTRETWEPSLLPETTGESPPITDSGGPLDIPFSDIESLSSEDKADAIFHQRLTINNISAILTAQKRLCVDAVAPFSMHQTLISSEKMNVQDINDDLSRELAFYGQCLDAARVGRKLLRKEGIPFTRPSDYFAEMVKGDEHMGSIKMKMVHIAANRKAATDARKLRDLKRFGKQVQISRLQERDKAKKETLEKIGILKRSTAQPFSMTSKSTMKTYILLERKDTIGIDAKEDDLFDVALDKASSKGQRLDKSRMEGRSKGRRQRDAKFGYGGRKRHAKDGDAFSAQDLRDFSVKKMKGQKTSPRLGKHKRATRK